MTEFENDLNYKNEYEPVPLYPNHIGVFLRSYIVPGTDVVKDVYVVNNDIKNTDLDFIHGACCYDRIGNFVVIARQRYHYEKKYELPTV